VIYENRIFDIIASSFTDTYTSNNIYESIEETTTQGNPKKRKSFLEHKWTINVTSGVKNQVTFYVESYHTLNSENDDFVFAYSEDDVSYTDMVTVTKTSDDDIYQTFALPTNLEGTIYIRVKDTDQSPGNNIKDSIFIDHMFIRSIFGSDTVPPLVTINSPENITYTSSSIDFQVTLNEDGDTVQYTLDSGVNNITMSTTDNRVYTATNSSIADGSYTFQVYANDTAGNRNDVESVVFTVDTTSPTSPTQKFFDDCRDLTAWNNPSGGWTAAGTCTNKNSKGVDESMNLISSIDLSGSNSATLTFDHDNNGLDVGEYLRIYANSSVDPFILLVEITSNDPNSKNIDLGTFITLNSGVHLRATCNNNKNNERCVWDNVNLTGS